MSINRKRAARRRRKERRKSRFERDLAYARGAGEPTLPKVWAVPRGVSVAAIQGAGGGGGGGPKPPAPWQRGPVQEPDPVKDVNDFLAKFGTPVGPLMVCVDPDVEYEIKVGGGGTGASD